MKKHKKRNQNSTFCQFVDGGAGVKSRLHPAALMMYIENTALDDNLHHILNDRVPSSRSPNSTETEAESALITHVRENNETEGAIEPGAGEEVDCSHFFIELADNISTDSDVVVEKENSQEPQDETEEEEFEYILTRVPKRRTGASTQSEGQQNQEQQLLDCRLVRFSH